MSSPIRIINVPVFSGHGTAAIASPATLEQVVRDATHPAGALLLSACCTAFRRELSSLSSRAVDDLDLPAFDTPNDFLSNIIVRNQQNANPFLSSLALFLVQSLRFLVHVETNVSATTSLDAFTEHLNTNSEHGIGVLGFSSGILPVCAVSSSTDTLSYIHHAVEIFRYAFWLGLRCHQYQLDAARNLPLPRTGGHHRSWSRIVIGRTTSEISDTINAFNAKEPHGPQVYLTAITDDTNVTVSGRPDILQSFVDALPSTYQVLNLPLDTLYHSPIHHGGVRQQVLSDVDRRGIRFPTMNDLRAPIRSSFTGDVVTARDTPLSLVDVVTDMILTQPVHWDRVTKKLAQASPDNVHIRLLNFGPGTGLAKTLARAFPSVSSDDLTIDNRGSACPPSHPIGAQVPIAIVGMAVNMPGAPNVSKLWEILEQGINTISEIPKERFNVSEYNHPSDKNSKRAMKAHTGNFISGPGLFDPKFFRISPREAKSMDPQQRILLHTAYEALENAGYVPDATPSFRKDTFGCYIGAATEDYVQNLQDEIDVYYSTGTLRAFLSGRISYAMGFSGPSIVVDTACSSSVVSIYQACRALSNGDCNAALAGGVNVISSPDMMIGLDRAHFLSPTGQCKPFDSSADGYSRAEGCGLFVLKRLSDAVAENDNILGVIRGIEINQSGNAHSITHPHAPTQVALFDRLLKKAGIDKQRVNVIEAHGTGTRAGDPNELESIRKTFSVGRSKSNPLHITSVKANIGHLEAASGAAGLAKLLLMLQHRTIPRLISLKNLNPLIAPLQSDNTMIDTVASGWAPSHPGTTRISMLNNFGAAGSNGALLLEEHVPASVGSKVAPVILPFCLSAKDSRALDELRKRYIDFLTLPANESLDLADVAYTMTARRQIYPARMAVTASTRRELIDKLQKAIPTEAKPSDADVAFVFSGQGSQYLGMGAELYRTSAAFKARIDECRSLLLEMGFNDILSVILAQAECFPNQAVEVEVYQTAVFSLEYSLAQFWMSWGLKPKAVIGHSLGEYAALTIAGVMTLRSALLVVASRARLMTKRCALGHTGMIAINHDPTVIATILVSSTFGDLNIACYNSLTDCVVAGPRDQLQALKSHLDVHIGCKSTLLSVPFGYHSAAMLPLVDEFQAVVEGIRLSPPAIPIVSNVYGTLVEPGDGTIFTSTYFPRHCIEPVRFSDGFAALLADARLASGVWIEVGPHPTTLPMMKACPALPKAVRLLPSLRRQQDPWSVVSSTLCSLYLETSDVAWRRVYEQFGRVSCVALPSYPFASTRFWVDFKERNSARPSLAPQPLAEPGDGISEFSLIHSCVQPPSSSNGHIAIFEVPMTTLSTLIKGHLVGEHPLCPASVYHEVAMASIHLSGNNHRRHHYISLRDVEYEKPLVYILDDHRRVRITVFAESSSFVISSVGSTAGNDAHCRGKFSWVNASLASQSFLQATQGIVDKIAALSSNKEAELFSTRTAYELIFPRVVDYSKEYQSMERIWVHPSGMEGHAVVKVPHTLTPGTYAVHPVFMDTLLHVAGFVANMQASHKDAYICSHVESVDVIPQLVDVNNTYSVLCRNTWIPEKNLIVAEAYAVTSGPSSTIVAHLKGMHFRKVRLSGLKRALNHGQSTPAPASVQPSTPSKTHGLGSVLERIQIVVAETCDIPAESVDVSSDLPSLGVDSLMSIEIFGRLQSLFPSIELDRDVVSSSKSISDIAAQVAGKGPRSAETTPTRPNTPHSSRSDATEDTLNAEVEEYEQQPDVKRIIAGVLEINAEDFDDDTELESLGLDSLTSIEVMQVIQDTFSVSLPQELLASRPTTKSIDNFIFPNKRLPTQVPREDSAPALPSSIIKSLIPDQIPAPLHRGSTDASPLFLIHDGSGLINHYSRILDIERDVWGIFNPKFTTSGEWNDLETMASHYASIISQTLSEGPLILGGWSFGGVVAYEAARKLTSVGRTVKGVVLIDSPSPVDHVPLSPSLIDTVVNSNKRSCGVRQLIQKQFTMNSKILGRYRPTTAGPHPPLILLRSSDGVEFNTSDVMDVPAWLRDRDDPSQASLGWQKLTGATIKVVDIPGNHFEAFSSVNIPFVSRALADACVELERVR